ncbi:MAG: branched-chain amino acid aminotransferase [Clostridia bacterium]|nr:branched-chain amino acid aminotransferase [Clostridia bacterium]MBR3714566.1 branched-chain amino acid aminotransferase [Clostridia bacterium]
MLNIRYEYTTEKKVKPDYSKLGFGKYFTDHMFMMDYTEGQGWHDARIVPFQNLSLSPATAVFHYAQEMFEGLKAYKTADGKIQLFRPQKNIERLNNTNRRMCIPEIDPDDVLQAIKAVVKTDEDWIPEEEGKSLYIRPFIIATDAMLGVHPSHSYLFCIILSPVGAYYATGINPVKIYVEPEYVRAVKGGTGFAKVGGNYAASLKGQEVAEKLGYAQVLWLDGIHHKYIDEVGAMNVFFVIDGEIITPTLENGNILPGVTRDSAIQLLRSWGYKVSERLLSIDEIREAADNGKLDEAFGTGTAAVISPIGELNEAGKVMIINEGKIGPISQRLYNNLTGIQWGTVEDTMGWTVAVD